MDKKELEDFKKRLENSEFNNLEEDIRVSKEESVQKVAKHAPIDYNDDDGGDNKKNTIIIGLVIFIVILLIIIAFFVFGGKKSENSSNSDSNSSNTENQNSENKENNEKDDKEEKDTKVDEDKYDLATGSIYFNKYMYVTSKDKEKKVIATLDGNILLQTKSTWRIFEGKDNSLYVVNLNYKETGTVDIKKIKDNIVTDLFKEKGNGLLLGAETENLVGVYKQDTNKDTLYIFEGTSYNTIDLENHAAYVNNNASKDNKYVYNNKYIITFDKMSQEDFEDYGIYDLKAKKQVVKGSYDGIIFLHDDIFAAIKKDKTGIIDTNDKVLLDFKNEVVTYSNGLYFIGNNNKLEIYDNNLKNLNQTIDVPSLNKYNYSVCCGSINPFDLTAYKNNVIVRIGTLPGAASEYIAVEKNGTKHSLGKGYIKFINNNIVTSTETDTNVRIYNEALNVIGVIDIGEKSINLANSFIFLNNTLVINRNKIYDINANRSKGTTSWYKRISQEFEVKIDFKGETGTVTISRHEEILQKIENVSVNAFLEADNNGISITKEYFIYNADGIAVIKRNEQDVIEQSKR